MLRWQFEWQGPRLQNLRILVCETCLDQPQPGLRTILIPPDPIPIQNPRPENYVAANNPLSGIGANANPTLPSGTLSGNMTQNGGVAAAFDGNLNKPWTFSAVASAAQSTGTITVTWANDPSGVSTPSVLTAPTQVYTASQFVVYAPNDAPLYQLGSAPIQFQGSNDGVTWTTLFSGNTVGGKAEVFTGNPTGGNYGAHRVVITGDGVHWMSVAQFQISVSNQPNNSGP